MAEGNPVYGEPSAFWYSHGRSRSQVRFRLSVSLQDLTSKYWKVLYRYRSTAERYRSTAERSGQRDAHGSAPLAGHNALAHVAAESDGQGVRVLCEGRRGLHGACPRAPRRSVRADLIGCLPASSQPLQHGGRRPELNAVSRGRIALDAERAQRLRVRLPAPVLRGQQVLVCQPAPARAFA